jgi:uncharacterized membrane-anchored protein
MENINKKLGIILGFLSIISCIANYFNVLVLPATLASFVFSAFVGFIAMMQVYHYENWHDNNPGMFWFAYSAVSGVFLISVFYAVGFELISDQSTISILTGFSPTLLPTMGIFFGDIGRILFKGKPSVI